MKHLKPFNESVSRYCAFYKATDGNWYMELATDETDEDIEIYGPFYSFESAMQYLDRNFSNPGAFNQDDSGTQPVPENPIYPKRRW